MPETSNSTTPKNILKSKTLWFNILGGALTQLAPALPPEYAALGLVGGNILLRLVTKQPVNVMPQ